MTPETRALLAELLDEVRGLVAPVHSRNAEGTARALLEALLQEGDLGDDEYRQWLERIPTAALQSVSFRASGRGLGASGSLSVGNVLPRPGPAARTLSVVTRADIGGGDLLLTAVDSDPPGSRIYWRATSIDVDEMLGGALSASSTDWDGLEELGHRARELNRSDAARVLPEKQLNMFRRGPTEADRALYALYTMWAHGRIEDDRGTVYSVARESEANTNADDIRGNRDYRGSFTVMPAVGADSVTMTLRIFDASQEFSLSPPQQ